MPKQRGGNNRIADRPIMIKNKQNYKLLVNNSYMLLANGLLYLLNVSKLLMLK